MISTWILHYGFSTAIKAPLALVHAQITVFLAGRFDSWNKIGSSHVWWTTCYSKLPFHERGAHPDNWFTSYNSSNTFLRSPPPPQFSDTHFALYHYLTPCQETTEVPAGCESSCYLSNPFCPVGNALLLSTVPQGQAIPFIHRKFNFQVVSVRQHERSSICWIIIQPVTSVFHLTT